MIFIASSVAVVQCLWADAGERQLMRDIVRSIHQQNGGGPDLHEHVLRVRDYLLNHYVLPPKSQEQLSAWKKTRTFLRQTASETVAGKPALCGELARLTIKVLRAENIDARRLYLYKSTATNHVAFEYFDKDMQVWRVMDTYASSAYLNSLLAKRTLSVEELLREADPIQLVYDKFGYLPRPLFFYFGESRARAIPYSVSWWYEEVYLIRALVCMLVAGLSIGLVFWFKRLGASNLEGSDRHVG